MQSSLELVYVVGEYIHKHVCSTLFFFFYVYECLYKHTYIHTYNIGCTFIKINFFLVSVQIQCFYHL